MLLRLKLLCQLLGSLLLDLQLVEFPLKLGLFALEVNYFGSRRSSFHIAFHCDLLQLPLELPR